MTLVPSASRAGLGLRFYTQTTHSAWLQLLFARDCAAQSNRPHRQEQNKQTCLGRITPNCLDGEALAALLYRTCDLDRDHVCIEAASGYFAGSLGG